MDIYIHDTITIDLTVIIIDNNIANTLFHLLERNHLQMLPTISSLSWRNPEANVESIPNHQAVDILKNDGSAGFKSSMKLLSQR